MASDLISRDAMLEFAHNHIKGTIDCNDIARFPAVDAVEVVRCKNCVHFVEFCDGSYKLDEYADGECRIRRYDSIFDDYDEVKKSDFCRRGVKKDA